MRAGQLRQVIALQQNTPTKNGFGEPIASWATTATVYARAEPMSGREFVEGARRDGDVSFRFTVRYRSDIAPKVDWRILWGSRIFDIDAVLNVEERGQIWHIMAREVLT